MIEVIKHLNDCIYDEQNNKEAHSNLDGCFFFPENVFGIELGNVL